MFIYSVRDLNNTVTHFGLTFAGGMLVRRTEIAISSAAALGRATTIATRYWYDYSLLSI